MESKESRIAWESPSNGGDALLLRWRSGIYSRRKWLYLYGISIVGFIIVAVGSIWYSVSDSDKYFQSGLNSNWAQAVFFLYFFIIRFQLSSQPALIAVSDFEESRWETLSTTPVTSGEMLWALFRQCARYSTMILASICTLETYLLNITNITGGDSILGDPSWFLYVIKYFLYFMMLGFSLSALGLIFGLLWRRTIWIIVGLLIPLFLVLITGIMDFTSNYLPAMTSGLLAQITNYVWFLVVPEGFLSSIHNGITRGSGVYEYTDGQLVWIVTITAVVLWFIIWRILVVRRRDGYRSANPV